MWRSINSWSDDRHVRLCRRIAAIFGVRVRIYSNLDRMPKHEREFYDVHYQNHTIHIYNEVSYFIPAIWHEIGHLIVSDEACRNGINWVDPYPRPTRKPCRCETPLRLSKNDGLRQRNEGMAVRATISMIRALKLPREDRANILDYVGILHAGSHCCGDMKYVRCQVRFVIAKLRHQASRRQS